MSWLQEDNTQLLREMAVWAWLVAEDAEAGCVGVAVSGKTPTRCAFALRRAPALSGGPESQAARVAMREGRKR